MVISYKEYLSRNGEPGPVYIRCDHVAQEMYVGEIRKTLVFSTKYDMQVRVYILKLEGEEYRCYSNIEEAAGARALRGIPDFKETGSGLDWDVLDGKQLCRIKNTP